MEELGRALLLVGASLALLGLLFMLGGKAGLGRLPGDFVFHRGSFTIYVPIMTMLLVSIGLSLLLTLIMRLFRG
ncbi:MAG: DUF2905 domain-containing protein [Chloroflexi bacterium]|nr:DUF2905 domain-containing protein [Chloroflexota bacterium]